MTPAETAELLTFCAAFDRRTIGRADVAAWHTILADTDSDAAREAVAAHYARETRWIMPADIRTAVRAAGADRLARHTDPTPAADPDNPLLYKAELAATRRQVAAGRREPATHELTAGPMHPSVAERLATLGTYVPRTVDEQLDRFRPVKAERRSALAAGRPDALAVDCSWCGARSGEPCRRRRVDVRGRSYGSSRLPSPHPSRVDAAAGVSS